MPNEPVAPKQIWDSEKAENFIRRCAGAPPDFPHRQAVSCALRESLDAVAADYADFALWWSRSLRPTLEDSALSVVPGARNLLHGRSKSHGFYLLLLAMRRPHRVERLELRSTVYKLLGYWALNQYIDDWVPKNSAIARVRTLTFTVIERTDALGTIERYLTHARKRLNAAIQSNVTNAVEIGLASEQRTSKSESCLDTPWGTFNADIRRHNATHIRDASASEVRATLGKDTLSRNSLQYAGTRLRDRVRIDDESAIATCIQVITRLPERLIRYLPLSTNPEAARYFAHLDMQAGRYVFDLQMAVDIAEYPPHASANLFLPTTLGFVVLPPFIAKALRSKALGVSNAKTLGDLIRFDLPNPRTTLVKSHGHLITLSRIQASLPALLLAQGAHRWPVALATQSWWLVSKGRRAYSACSQGRINEATQSSYNLLGWGSIDCLEGASQFVGSALTPKPESLSRISDFLLSGCVAPHMVCKAEQVNHWAAYCTFMAAWLLALRDRVRYPIVWTDLMDSAQVLVNDKDAHIDPPSPIPVAYTLARIARAWCNVVSSFLANTKDTKPGIAELTDRIRSSASGGKFPLFHIDGMSTVIPAGTDTWLRHLPAQLRPSRNFGRHYWPWRLMERGLVQRQVDLLMRHQTTYLVPYGAKRMSFLEEDSRTLRGALEEEMLALLGDIPLLIEMGVVDAK